MRDMIKVGTITSTHGIRGEVKIIGDNPCFSKDFKEPLYIDTVPVTRVHIKSVKNQNGRLIVGFKEFDNINQVECFKNMAIMATRDSLGELEEDEVYLQDLIDMEVYNEDNEYRGIYLLQEPADFKTYDADKNKSLLVSIKSPKNKLFINSLLFSLYI